MNNSEVDPSQAVHPGFDRLILEAVGEAIIMTDVDGKITYWNRAAEKLFGWSSAEVLGKSAIEITAADVSEQESREIMADLRTGRSWTGEILLTRRDGTIFPARVTDTPVPDEHGNLIGVVGISYDITPQKQAEKTLRYERERLGYTFEHAPAFICIARGPDHVIEMANPACYDIVGQRDILGKPVREVLPELHEQGFIDHADRVLETGESHVGRNAEVHFKQSPGGGQAKNYINYVYEPLIEADGSVSGIFVHGIDITEHVRAREAAEASAKMNRMIMDNSADVICTVDHDGMFVQISAACERIWGYRPDELVGRPYMALVHEDDVQITRETAGSLENRGRINNFENRYIHKDGSVVHMSWSSVWSEDDQMFYAVARNVTDLKKAETARARAVVELERSEAKFRRVIDNTSDLIGLLDSRAVISFLSPSSQVILGYEPLDLAGSNAFDLVHPDDIGNARRTWANLLTKGGTVTHTVRVHSRSGEWRWLESIMTNLLDDPVVGAVVAVARDVTESRRSRKELLEARDRAEEMVRLKDSFLANMSHEIRTPLAGILGYAEVLTEIVEGDEKEFVQIIELNARRLLDTINSVLDLAQLNSQTLKLTPMQFDAGRELEEIVHLFRRIAENKHLTLELDTPSSSVYLVTDRAAFGRIITNLVSNALKFTIEGGVNVILTAGDDHLAISVQDTGIGIGPDFLPNLFHDFRQESGGLSRNFEGSGLGLAIIRRLVDLLNAGIEVSSEPGKGSTFTVRFPMQDIPEEEPSRLPAREGNFEIKPRILVVEDNVQSRDVLEIFLGAEYIPEMASTFNEALGLAQNTQYDALLIDINLSGSETGVDLLHKLRGLAGYADTPMIACTAYNLPGDRERFLEAGFDAYVSKPFLREELLDSVRRTVAPRVREDE